MDLKKAVIIPKTSKLEYDMHRLRMTEQQVIEFYKKENLNVEKILDSHKRQKEGLSFLKKWFNEDQILSRNSLSKETISEADLVITYGGDNHFTYVTHFIEKTPIVGINSDPMLSDGALTSITAAEFEKFIEQLKKNECSTENWLRLEIMLDGKKLDALAVSEIFIGETQRNDMSRQILTYKGETERQKGSGLIISTGAGSGGWYNSACRYLFPQGDPFPFTAGEARFVLSEPQGGRLTQLKLIQGSIKEGEELIIQSLNDAAGLLAIDSHERITLKEGSILKISLGKPLKVLKLKG